MYLIIVVFLLITLFVFERVVVNLTKLKINKHGKKYKQFHSFSSKKLLKPKTCINCSKIEQISDDGLELRVVGYYNDSAGKKCTSNGDCKDEKLICSDYLQKNHFVCLPRKLPSTDKKCTNRLGGKWTMEWDRKIEEYKLFCRCEYPQIFSNNQTNGDCDVLTACDTPIPGTTDSIENLRCQCPYPQDFIKFGETYKFSGTDITITGPTCVNVNFFRYTNDPFIYTFLPVLSPKAIEPEYVKLFYNFSKRTLPDPCHIDALSNRIIPEPVSSVVILNGAAQCRINEEYLMSYATITFDTDYLLGNNGKYPNAVIKLLNNNVPYNPDLINYELNLTDSFQPLKMSYTIPADTQYESMEIEALLNEIGPAPYHVHLSDAEVYCNKVLREARSNIFNLLKARKLYTLRLAPVVYRSGDLTLGISTGTIQLDIIDDQPDPFFLMAENGFWRRIILDSGKYRDYTFYKDIFKNWDKYATYLGYNLIVCDKSRTKLLLNPNYKLRPTLRFKYMHNKNDEIHALIPVFSKDYQVDHALQDFMKEKMHQLSNPDLSWSSPPPAIYQYTLGANAHNHTLHELKIDNTFKPSPSWDAFTHSCPFIDWVGDGGKLGNQIFFNVPATIGVGMYEEYRIEDNKDAVETDADDDVSINKDISYLVKKTLIDSTENHPD